MVTQRTPMNPVPGEKCFEGIVPGFPPHHSEILSCRLQIQLNFAENHHTLRP